MGTTRRWVGACVGSWEAVRARGWRIMGADTSANWVSLSFCVILDSGHEAAAKWYLGRRRSERACHSGDGAPRPRLLLPRTQHISTHLAKGFSPVLRYAAFSSWACWRARQTAWACGELPAAMSRWWHRHGAAVVPGAAGSTLCVTDWGAPAECVETG